MAHKFDHVPKPLMAPPEPDLDLTQPLPVLPSAPAAPDLERTQMMPALTLIKRRLESRGLTGWS